MKDFFSRHANALTGLVAVLCLLVGVTLIDRPEGWKRLCFSLAILSVAFMLFLGARVILKAILSLSLLGFSVFFLFSAYSLFDVTSALYASVTLPVVYFFVLTVSYFFISITSRWTSLSVAVAFSFCFSYVAMENTYSPWLSVIAFSVAFFIVFAGMFFVPLLIARRSFPAFATFDTPEETDYIDGKMTYRIVERDGVNYALIPVHFTSPIGFGKKLSLRHEGKSLAPFCMYVLMKVQRNWGLRKKKLFPVLVDKNQVAVRSPKVIGVKLPDSLNVQPLGIVTTEDVASFSHDFSQKSDKKHT